MPDTNELSERELEILNLVATGASNKEIAQKLYISSNTVKVHLRNIFNKIEVSSRTEAAMYAVSNGLVEGINLPESGEAGAQAESRAEMAAGRIQVQRRRLWSVALVTLLLFGLVAGILFFRPPESSGQVATPLPAAESARWQSLAPMEQARAELAMVSYENSLYAIAGRGQAGATGLVERYDPATDRWETLKEKTTPVEAVQAATIGGKIYIPGGRLAGGSMTDVLEIYDPRQDSWEQGSPLPFALSAYGLVAFEGRLLLFGGWDGERYLDTVLAYTPGQDEWTLLTPLPVARAFSGAVVLGDRVYVIGGYDGQGPLDRVDVYTPSREDQGEPWSQGAPLPEGRYAMGVVSLVDSIYVIGGQGVDDEALPPLQYQAGQDSWEVFDQGAAESWSQGGLAIIGANLHVLGGVNGKELSDRHLAYRAVFIINMPVIR